MTARSRSEMTRIEIAAALDEEIATLTLEAKAENLELLETLRTYRRNMGTVIESSTIGEMWADWSSRLAPGEAAHERTKEAFYGGAAAMLSATVTIAELDADEGAARMLALDSELGDWLRILRRRRERIPS